MPTHLGRPYSVDWRGNPPHMLAPDVPVWYRFLERWGPTFLKLYYDCCLGGPFLTPEEERDPLKKGWRINLSKRADAIAELENEVWIIEVAAYAGVRFLGQLQIYRALWLRDPAIAKIERPVLVAETIDPDILDAAAMYGVQVYLI